MPLVAKRFFFALTTILLLNSFAYSQGLQDAKTSNYELGISLYLDGFFEESISKLEEFKSAYPRHELRISTDFYLARAWTGVDSANIEAHYQEFILEYPGSDLSVILLKDLGHRFTDQGNYDGAINYYNQAVQSWMGTAKAAETTYWVAEAAAEKQDYRQSRYYFLKLADEYPQSEWAPKALYARGRLYLTENEYDSSAIAFELLKERYPNNPITRRVGTALGESYYQQGRFEEAIVALDTQMPFLDDESKIKALFLMAEAHNYLGNYDEATKDYLQYINLTKGTDREAAAHYGLGWLYNRQKVFHWAAQSFERAIIGDDELSRKAMYYEAVNHKLAGNYQRSMETFQEFGDRYKSGLWVEEAYYEWSISAFEGGNYGESIETLLTLIRNQDQLKDPGKIYTMLGEAYFANNEFTGASRAFEEAEKVANIDPVLRRQARFQKAWILFRNQAYEQAQPIFEAVYAEAPNTELGEEALFWSADSYYKLDQFSNAARRFKLFIDNYPENEMIGAARYSLGWCYFKTGEYDLAVGPLEDFLNNYNPPPIALFPYDIDTRLRIGDAYYALGDYRNSIRFYNQAIGAEPGGDYAMFQVANSYYRSNRTFEAVSNFRRMLRIYPFSRLREQAQYNIAYIYLNTSNYSQAIEEFQTVISRYPGTDWAARSQYNIGDAYYNAGEYDRAIDAYKKVLDDYPRSRYIIEAINGIQYAQLSSGGADSSSVILEEFLGDNPQSSTADQLRYRQAETVFQTGDYEGAIREFRQYLRVTNSDALAPEAYMNLGESYRQIGQIDRAISSYQTVVDDYPRDSQVPPALTALGLLYYEQGDFDRSHGYFDQLLRTASRFSQEAYIGMGNASLAQGLYEDARQEYESALNVNAGNEAASVGLGKVALAEQNYEEAQSILAPIADHNTTEIGAEAQFRLGQLYQEQGDYEQAISEYAKVKVLFEAFDNWVSSGMYQSAECNILLGNRGDAIAILNEIIEIYPGTEAAQKAQELIDSSDS
ncbi:MAG: tetratricopeptide repeat protein [Balneola sp.]|nr:MAG: tetratricopeptide repeat protein [Balneola sp.]